MTTVTSEDIARAKSVSLYDYLLENYPSDFKAETKSLVAVKNRSLHIARTPFGNKSDKQYTDFNGTDQGDSIDFLVRHLGYEFKDAVLTLCGHKTDRRRLEQIAKPKDFFLPGHSETNDLAIEYLLRRGINRNIIDMLVLNDMVYQSCVEGWERVVFASLDRNYCEIHEIEGIRFRQPRDASAKSDNCWYMMKPSHKKPTIVYITECCIDAISLCQLVDEDAYYVSIGGARNVQRVQRIIDLGYEVVIATDNDEAGQRTRDHFSDYKFILPKNHDWNDDLQCKYF